MKTKFRKDKDIYFIDVEGQLDVLGMDHLKEFCESKLKKKKIVFNLKSLDFVGSKGVEIFSETLDVVSRKNTMKICCASSEFEKIIETEGLASSLCKDEEEAVLSFNEAIDK